MSTMLSWALWYRAQNLSIIPVSGKTPLISWKEFQGRIASEEEIKEWWEKWPEADIGCVTGAISNKLVLDIDGARGFKEIASLDCLTTQIVRTARGQQYHYKWPEAFSGKTTLAGLLPEVDVRGDGGYVKLPPSQFSDGSGRYEWVHGLQETLAECPQWLLDLLIEKNKPRSIDRESGESWLKEKLDAIAPGNRNATFTSIAGSLRSRGYSSGDIFELLSDKATGLGFELSELRTICDSVSQYEPKRVIPVQVEAQSVSDFLADQQTVEWIVPGLIAKKSIGFIAGLPETSKTWCMMDLAIEVAKGGGLWLGKFQVNGGKVLFVDQERFKGETQRRFKNILVAKQLESASVSLQILCGTTTRLNLQNSYEAFRKNLKDYSPDLVIVDSFATFHTASENDRMEIQKVLELVKQLRNEIGCTFMFINHEGKGVLHHEPGETKTPNAADMMGSIGVPAAAEVVFTVRRKDEESCMVYQTKNTLAAKIEPFSVSVVDVPEGIKVVGS